MKLSVVIVNYNVANFLEQCLHSVFKATQGIEAEVWVVDNNSVDASVAMVKQKFPQAHLIENKKNTGFSFANNQAMRLSKGEYILLLNPDTLVEEDTFRKVIDFMDKHPDAGGLGVKMIDGKGNFLPESKRGLPTPMVAFSKIFGLSALFPKSKLFGRYHLGFLDKEKTHQVEILSGAFMLMRKSVLDKIGLLDEDFFMYGEDIDLSYRIVKAGYYNYYFPETRIIHYKGESTKKGSVNYVLVFYRAMIIFAQKHFSAQHARVFSLLINMAVYFRAGLAIGVRLCRQLFLPVLEFAQILIALLFLVNYWENHVKYVGGGNYPEFFKNVILPVYSLIWIIGIWLSGGYDKPNNLFKSVKGILYGTIFILILYAVMPDNYRFSRSVLLIGSGMAVLLSVLSKYLLSLTGINEFRLESRKKRRFMIAGRNEEALRVRNLLELTGVNTDFVEIFNPSSSNDYLSDDVATVSLRMKDMVRINKIDEVIFCAENMPSGLIISLMLEMSSTSVDFKIAPPESLILIGSNSTDTAGDLYMIDLNSINKPASARNKRIFDVLTSCLLLAFSPLLIWFQNKPGKFYTHIIQVLSGSRSWVGYVDSEVNKGIDQDLPPLRKGVLTPAVLYGNTFNNAEKMNIIYSKDYSVLRDLKILIKGLRQL